MVEINSILAIKAKTGYHANDFFLDSLVTEWLNEGIEVDILDPENSDLYMKVRQEILKGKRYDMLFSFNGLFLEKQYEIFQLLLDNEPVYCTWLLDHPMRHHFRLMNTYSKLHVLVIDRKHEKYIKKYYPNIKNVHFLPHGGAVLEEIIPFEKKKRDIVFIGSYGNSDRIWQSFCEQAPDDAPVLEDIARFMKKQTSISLEDALQLLVNMEEESWSADEFRIEMRKLYLVDYYIRNYFREYIITQLLSNGYTVDVYGNDWDNFRKTVNGDLRVHDSCSYQESLIKTAEAKLSLNVMPWFKAGSHERVFTALGCGTIPLTDESEYLLEINQNNIMAMYSLDCMESLFAQVDRCLTGNNGYYEIIKRGRRCTLEHHTWACRAKWIIEHVAQTY